MSSAVGKSGYELSVMMFAALHVPATDRTYVRT
jgi:hypothetical protein